MRLPHPDKSGLATTRCEGFRMTGQGLSTVKDEEPINAIKILGPCYNWDGRKQWAKKLQFTILR
jgi:hypothetical protein